MTNPAAAPSQHIQLANMDAKATVESVLEFSSILGIAQPQLLALDGTPRGIYIAPSEVNHDVIAGWVRLVDLSNSKDPKVTEDVAVKKELVALRRRVLEHLGAQAELRLTQLILDNLVSHELGAVNENSGKSKATELAPATKAALRQKAADQFNELRSAAQKAVLDTDLQQPLETGKSEIIVTPLPLKYVSSQQAQATILNTSRLFGVFPEMPTSDIRTNLLIIVKNGRQKYFTCLAETLDRSSQADTMTFDEQIELWKNRLRLLAMLGRAVE